MWISDQPEWKNDTVNFWIQIRGFVPNKSYPNEKNTAFISCEAGGMGSLENTQQFGSVQFVNQITNSVINYLNQMNNKKLKIGGINLVSFSGGYGAVGKILEQKDKLSGPLKEVRVLDGIHEGTHMSPAWINWAKETASDPSKKFLIVHTNIKPGIYASTKDSADFILQNLGLKREQTGKENVVTQAGAGGFQVLEMPGTDAQAHMKSRDFGLGIDVPKNTPKEFEKQITQTSLTTQQNSKWKIWQDLESIMKNLNKEFK